MTPAPDTGRTSEEMPAALRANLMPEAENLAVALTEAVLADGLGFKGPFEEFGRIAEPLLLDALGAARRDGAQIANAAWEQTHRYCERQWQDERDVFAVKLDGSEARVRILHEHMDWWRNKAKAAEAEAAQLRSRLLQAEKGGEIDLDQAMKRGIRAWSAKLHIPVTRMMSRALREAIQAALAAKAAPLPETRSENTGGRS